ncbi:MAG: PQQ-binding-like beta-propeller repeat protein [Candidatus Solibacter usitatus]|nr:PQQ-binding-like beta-propeller repeat protein [Candidatus Solibacter usitatus]
MKPRLLLAFSLLTLPANPQVTYERIRNAHQEPGNWLTYSGGYRGWRYSLLDQITPLNAGGLKVKWVYQMPTTHLVETTPLVADGVMYFTEPPSNVVAVDAETGRQYWRYARVLPPKINVCCGQVNRGVAIAGDRVFVGTVDAHLVALDAKTGAVLWDVQVADYRTGHSITVAPLIVKDMVISGISGGEYGIRGFLDAYDQKTGQRRWRFWTIPEPGQPGGGTWSGESWKTGGGPTWVTGAFDVEQNLIVWGTGNPSPDWNGDSRLGDNLYSDSAIALDADSGKLKWYFQFVPHDVHDWDWTGKRASFCWENRSRPRPGPRVWSPTGGRSGCPISILRRRGLTSGRECRAPPTGIRPATTPLPSCSTSRFGKTAVCTARESRSTARATAISGAFR